MNGTIGKIRSLWAILFIAFSGIGKKNKPKSYRDTKEDRGATKEKAYKFFYLILSGLVSIYIIITVFWVIPTGCNKISDLQKKLDQYEKEKSELNETIRVLEKDITETTIEKVIMKDNHEKMMKECFRKTRKK